MPSELDVANHLKCLTDGVWLWQWKTTANSFISHIAPSDYKVYFAYTEKGDSFDGAWVEAFPRPGVSVGST